MARPTTITDEQILDAAREIFLEHGLHATTALVAHRAGVSEGSIFNRFKTKIELFHAAMDPLKERMSWAEDAHLRAGQGTVPDQLLDIARQTLKHFRTVTPLMFLNWSNFAKDGPPAMFADPNPPPHRHIRALAGYIEAEIKRGRVRGKLDAEVFARTLLGAIHAYTMLEMCFHAAPPLPEETFLRGLVDVVWGGLAPSGSSK